MESLRIITSKNRGGEGARGVGVSVVISEVTSASSDSFQLGLKAPDTF